MLKLDEVDLRGVIDGLSNGSVELSVWFDPATGQVEYRDAGAEDLDEDADHPAERGLVEVEPMGSAEGYADMADFVAEVQDERARDLLAVAIQGRGAFRRFRDVLHGFPELAERWRTGQDRRMRARAIRWLALNDLVDPAEADAELDALVALNAADAAPADGAATPSAAGTPSGTATSSGTTAPSGPPTPSATALPSGDDMPAGTPVPAETDRPNLLAGQATLLPDETDRAARAALAAGTDPRTVAARHPASSLAWATLARAALADGDAVAGYAYARTGYHRGLDALRRAGWRGQGPIPAGHEPNQGFLRALLALADAAAAIGEEDEAARCATFLDDADPDARRLLG